MALADIPLTAIGPADLTALVTDGVREGRRIEFKELVGTDDAARREFLADVSSLANAAGGDLLIGVEEADGVAARLVGISHADVDGEILRLENILRDGIEPRLAGVQTRAVDFDDGLALLVMRIPRSWAGPHMVTFKGLSRFFSRNSAGKYQLDVAEIRAAFTASESAQRAVRSFRLERLARITADQGAVPLLANAKVVLHVIPLSITDAQAAVDLATLANGQQEHLRPLRGNGWNTRVNFDGAVAFNPGRQGEPPWSYTQAFRNGAIEGVDAFTLSTERSGATTIPSTSLEAALLGAFQMYLALLHDLDISPPFVVATSYLGVRGFEMAVNPRYFESGYAIDRDDLIVPETLVEDLEQPADTLFKPQLDALWNAVGFPASVNYDEHDRWHSPS